MFPEGEPALLDNGTPKLKVAVEEVVAAALPKLNVALEDVFDVVETAAPKLKVEEFVEAEDGLSPKLKVALEEAVDTGPPKLKFVVDEVEIGAPKLKVAVGGVDETEEALAPKLKVAVEVEEEVTEVEATVGAAPRSFSSCWSLDR